MKVKELIDALNKFDLELEVQVFHDIGAVLIDEPTLYSGNYEDPNNRKGIRKTIKGQFVGIGNPADYDIDDENLPEMV